VARAARTEATTPGATRFEAPRARSSQGFTAEDQGLTRQRVPVRAARPGLAALALGSAEVEEAPAQPLVDMLVDAMAPRAARAYAKLPKARSDGPPLSGVGASGIHVDRIGVGSAYADGDCDGEGSTFSVRGDGQAHVCFRIVHPRQAERVTVRWEQDGKLVRRTMMKIPPQHAYRTRAGLGLRRAFIGQWTVRVVDDAGVELARADFDVVH